MADNFVRDLPPLTETEEHTALIPISALGDMDVTHKLSISGLVDAQQRESSIPTTTTRTLLASYTSSNRASETTENSLNYQDNQKRHAFNNGYNFLVVVIGREASNVEDFSSQIIEISQWNASRQSDPIPLVRQSTSSIMRIWKTSEQSFGISDQQQNYYLRDIYGYRILSQAPQPAERLDLHFQSTPQYFVVYNRNLSVTLPPALGGLAPYTYSISGSGTFDSATRGYRRDNITSSYSFMYTVTDGNNDTETITIAVTAGAELMLPRAVQSGYTPNWSGGRPQIPFSVNLPQATGGTPPYTHSISLYEDGVLFAGGGSYILNPTTLILQVTSSAYDDISGELGFNHTVRDATGQQTTNEYRWTYP